MVEQGSRCFITRQIVVEGMVAFESGEQVVVESIQANAQMPDNKYVVYSPKMQKRFLLSDADLVVPQVAPQPQPSQSVYQQPVQPVVTKTRSRFGGKKLLVAAIVVVVIIGAGIGLFFLLTGSKVTDLEVKNSAGGTVSFRGMTFRVPDGYLANYKGTEASGIDIYKGTDDIDNWYAVVMTNDRPGSIGENGLKYVVGKTTIAGYTCELRSFDSSGAGNPQYVLLGTPLGTVRVGNTEKGSTVAKDIAESITFKKQ